jgi:hypothetical protein
VNAVSPGCECHVRTIVHEDSDVRPSRGLNRPPRHVAEKGCIEVSLADLDEIDAGIHRLREEVH